MKLSDVVEYIDMQIVLKFQLNRLRIAEVTKILVSFPLSSCLLLLLLLLLLQGSLVLREVLNRFS